MSQPRARTDRAPSQTARTAVRDVRRPGHRRRERRVPDWGADALWDSAPRRSRTLAITDAGAVWVDGAGDRESAYADAAGRLPTSAEAEFDSPAPADREWRYAPRADGGGGERRTIVVRGRPDPVASLTRPPRRRPPRTVPERLGGQPDRVAAWAVGLGLLLALCALFSPSASAAPARSDRAAERSTQTVTAGSQPSPARSVSRAGGFAVR